VSFKDIFSSDIKHIIMEAIQQQYPDLFLLPPCNLEAATFTIEPENIIFHYNPGCLGCWADGEQYIEIPIDTAQLFLSSNWKHLFR
jgi:hypothetical protein